MRDPERIPKIIKRLQNIWEKQPDTRLGQLIENVYPNTPADFIPAYYEEDEAFIKTLEDFYTGKPIFRRFGKRQCWNQSLNNIITTDDGKKWMYDDKHQEWIEITMPDKLKGKLKPLR